MEQKKKVGRPRRERQAKEPKKMGRPTKRPEDMKHLLELYEHFSAKQIAMFYEVSEGTVRSWVCRARKEQNTYE